MGAEPLHELLPPNERSWDCLAISFWLGGVVVFRCNRRPPMAAYLISVPKRPSSSRPMAHNVPVALRLPGLLIDGDKRFYFLFFGAK